MAPGQAPRFISFLASRLAMLAESNDYEAVHDMRGRWPKKFTGFDCEPRPSMTVEDYLMEIFDDIECSPCCYMAAFIYICRFCGWNHVLIDPLNVHLLILTSVLVAVKFWEDDCCNNATMAVVGGMKLEDVNSMELEFLFGVNFYLFITEVEFHNYCRMMQVQIDAQFPQSPLQLPRLFYEEDDDDEIESDGKN